ncbi:MAG: putative periplasmic protein, partial [Hyphomicrobiales bacterium]|nr:putative periplasmic protein [Hyphomicrobiales bacterium]
MDKSTTADLVLHHGLITTLDRSNPIARAVAIKDGKVLAVGRDQEIMALAGAGTRIVDLKGKRVLPGLIDNHTHVVRGGLNFNMELRWDGVRSLAHAMAMLKHQVEITPPPQWVRIIGGFTEHQFAEKRLPTIEEINTIAPDTPVFILHLYDRALLNAAALRAVGYVNFDAAPPNPLHRPYRRMKHGAEIRITDRSTTARPRRGTQETPLPRTARRPLPFGRATAAVHLARRPRTGRARFKCAHARKSRVRQHRI